MNYEVIYLTNQLSVLMKGIISTNYVSILSNSLSNWLNKESGIYVANQHEFAFFVVMSVFFLTVPLIGPINNQLIANQHLVRL